MYSDLILYPQDLKRKGKPYYFAPGHPDRLAEERRAKLRKRRARSDRSDRRTRSKPKAKDRPANAASQTRLF